MVTVTIDGHEVQVADGVNLVEAARAAGVEIPTYCYHPGLRVVGQCRVCFVEVEGMPRLVTACSTPVKDGMVVNTANDRVREARQMVLEFLLANHPLDCPVCDQAGECYLQDYSVEFGTDSTHMVDDRRRYPDKERVQLGPHVIQNQNRCIHCTRCIRFTQEISETWDLTMKSRGNHSYIDTFDGEPLDNPWSACVADVCPVGALTVKEFRFRARVWHLEDTPSICPGCSVGCAIEIGHLKGTVHRFKPRENPEINGWWMCDHGRFLAEDLNTRDLDVPRLRGEHGLQETGWAEALTALTDLIEAGSPLRVIASANATNEALYLAKRLFLDRPGAEAVVPVHRGEEHRVKNAQRQWVTGTDEHPNSTGARLMGFRTVDADGLEAFLRGGRGPILVLDGSAHPWLESAEAARAVTGQKVAVVARKSSPLTEAAYMVLPLASWIETEGTLTSSTGRVQLAQRGLFPRGQAKPAWEILALTGRQLGVKIPSPLAPRTFFEAMAAEVPAFAGMTYRRLGTEPGIPVLEEVAHVG